MPSDIHNPTDFLNRNKALREKYSKESEDQNRSKSRDSVPDFMPTRGPQSRPVQRDVSPVMHGMQLKSNFGRRQIASYEKEESFRDRSFDFSRDTKDSR